MSCNTPFKINLFISLLSIFFLSVGISPFLSSLATPISEINIKSGKTYSYELDNGLRILIKENHNHPLVAISALVDAGSSSEYGFYGSGISHFIEHMLFKGTEKYKTGEIHKIIQSLGGTINGYTTLDYTLYHVTVPVENFNTALDIISDMLQNATFNEDEFNKEKKVILEEIKMNEDKPEKSVLLNLWNEAFTKHPYRFPVIGKRLLFLNLTREDLFRFYKRRYAPNNIILSIAGDINHKDAYFKVSKLFSKFNPRPYEIKSLDSIEPRQRLKRKRIEEIETQLVYLALGFKSVDINSKDIYALDVLAHILGKGRSSRLALKLKDEEELVYSIESFNYTPKYKGLFIITAILEEDNLDDTICAIFKEIDRIKDKGVDETELEKAKNTILVNGLKYLQTLEAQAQDIATSLYLTNDADFTYKYLKRINQQTKRDIQRVAKKYLISERSTISLVLPKSKSSEVKHHNDNKSKEVKPIKKIILSNGITLLLKEDRSLPLVDIQLVFEGGLRYETKDNNGICNLMTQLFLEGTKNRTKYELNRSLEERGISINTFSQNNSFGISASLLSKDLEFAISLLSDILLCPEFSKDALKHKKKIIKAAIRKEEDDIFGYGFLTLRKNFFKNHPYAFNPLGSIESIEAIKRKEIEDFYKKMVRPDNLIIAIFGDIDEKRAETLVRRYFGKLKGTFQPKSEFRNDNFYHKTKEIKKSVDKKQALILIGFPAPSFKNRDRYAFDVINALLEGGGSRLFYNLRDKKALCYQVGTFSMMGFEPGCWVFYIATSKENIDKAKANMIEEIKRIKRYEVTTSEINRAKRYLIGNHIINLQTNAALSFRCALDQMYDLGYDDYLNYKKMVEKITINDLKLIIDKYLDLNTSTTVILIPQNNR